MEIAIISDSHDNVPNLERALAFINSEKISLIIHCGDLCSPSFLSEVLIPKFSGQIHLVHGNVDDRESLIGTVKKLANVKLHGDVGEIEIDGKNIGFAHKPEEAKSLAQTNKYDLVFYGHTHKPWEEKVNNTRLINPGNLAGMFYKATFAIYGAEADKLELKILETLQ